jgi:hypothetical protein
VGEDLRERGGVGDGVERKRSERVIRSNYFLPLPAIDLAVITPFTLRYQVYVKGCEVDQRYDIYR